MSEKSYEDQVAEAKQHIREVSPREVLAMHERGERPVLLDVREPMEWNLGYLPGAVHVPLGSIASQVEAKVPRDRPVVIYCARGNRSALAAEEMQRMGYTDVASMSQGFLGWIDAGGDVEG